MEILMERMELIFLIRLRMGTPVNYMTFALGLKKEQITLSEPPRRCHKINTTVVRRRSFPGV